MSIVDIDAKIPNNVDLAGDRRLQRALESWQPKFIEWWRELGPVAFQDNAVYLRTAISVGPGGLGQLRLRRRCPTTDLPLQTAAQAPEGDHAPRHRAVPQLTDQPLEPGLAPRTSGGATRRGKK